MPQTPTTRIKQLKPPVADGGTLTTREKIILLSGSKLHDCKFRPWEGPPEPAEFEGLPYEDEYVFHLSEEQLKIFDSWQQCSDSTKRNGSGSATKQLDLVQDLATDCSVVASLCAETARVERAKSGNQSLIPSLIYPSVGPSKNGKYICRLNFNGCFRRVEIDDRLPVSKTGRTLHVKDRRDGSIIWPALAEKAYFKVTGGYDFPGSNSGTDLWVLTGWIPEQIFLQSNEIVPSRLWRRIYQAFNYGDVLITIGTGSVTRGDRPMPGLARAHAYAVIDMEEEDQRRMLRIKNPWSEGDNWGSETSPEPNNAVAENEDTDRTVRPVTFWMELSNVLQQFETIYLNWNPGLFSHRRDVHFTWDMNQRSKSNSFASNPQYLIRSTAAGSVWLLLSKHYSDFSRDEVRQGSPDPRVQQGYLSLYAFESQHRVELSQGSLIRASYANAPYVLLRFETVAGTNYVIVPSEQEMPGCKVNFTLSAFTESPLKDFRVAPEKYSHTYTQHGSWTGATAGGNSNNAGYHSNPQFKIVIPKTSGVLMVLEAEDPGFAVQVRLVWADGKRVPQHITRRDIYGDSGEYRRGCALAELPEVLAGTYTIVCSTFKPGSLGSFQLRVRTDCGECTLSQISAWQSGMFSSILPQAILPINVDRILIPVYVSRLASFHARVYSKPLVGAPTPSPLKLSLEFGQGPNKITLTNTADFADPVRGSIRTDDVDLKPSMCERDGPGLWLVVERMAGASTRPEEAFVEAFSDEQRLSFGQWGTEVDEPIEEFEKRLNLSNG